MPQSLTQVVNGYVVDNSGAPLTGAIVEANDGSESVIVDADGRYSIEIPLTIQSITAKYTGMKAKQLPLNGRNNLIFVMSKEMKGGWFINGEWSLLIDPTSTRMGAMGGYLGKWGGYVKFLYASDKYSSGLAITAGVIKSIKDKIFVYGGAGYAEDGVMFDIGGMFKVSEKININVGYSIVTCFDGLIWAEHEIHSGVGYCF
jgi:hypothetical protein